MQDSTVNTDVNETVEKVAEEPIKDSTKEEAPVTAPPETKEEYKPPTPTVSAYELRDNLLVELNSKVNELIVAQSKTVPVDKFHEGAKKTAEEKVDSLKDYINKLLSDLGNIKVE